MLYEVLTGVRPFRGTSTVDIMQAVTSVVPPDPRRLSRQVPRELAAICMKALAKEPGGRYQTAREFAADLRDYRNFLPIAAAPPTVRDRVIKWMRRNPRASAALLTLVAAILVFGVVRASRLAAERASVDVFWARYQETIRDIERMEGQLATADLSQAARVETSERLALRVNDARSLAGALIGLTRGRPDPRVIGAVTARLRHDVNQAMAEGNFVRAKVLAETRLDLVRELEGQLVWPDEDLAFLRTALEQANARLAASPR
jgi:hypothetical protein